MPKNSTQPGGRRKFSQLFLGVDGGGTKTNVALMNESGEVAAEAKGGPSNPLRVGVETAVANIFKALSQACDAGGFSRTDIHGLRRAYRLLFAAEGTLMERVDDVAQEFAGEAIVDEIIAFIRAGGKRSLCTPKSGADA